MAALRPESDITMSEKVRTIGNVQIQEDVSRKIVDTKVVTGNEAFNEAMIKEPPSPWSKPQIVIYFCSLIGFFCATMNGYDGSLINNLLQNKWFQEAYGAKNDGIWAGIIASIYQIGGVVALPFVGPVVDGLGRRIGMGTGSLIIVLGTVIQGTANSTGQFMGGRFLLGFGVSFAVTSGPTYIVEINHPAYRGVVGAMYNTLWFSGAIVASGAARGALNVGGNYSWKLITWLQILFPAILLTFCLLLPESPRWLYVHNKKDEAKAVLTKYHGHGDPDSAWVQLQLQEYEALLNQDGADKRWWDYSALFRSKANSYRISCCLIVSVFGQWAGNAVLSYFLGAVLDTAGYTSSISQSNITLINNCQQFLCAIVGATLVDRVGRRPLMLFSFAGVTVVWFGMTIASSQFAASFAGNDANGIPVYTNHAASKAALALIIIFGSIFSIGITPMQGLYTTEVLSFEMRAKGLAFANLAVNAAGLLNQFAWPVSMEKIGWRTYIIFTIWDAIQTAVVYFVLPETRNRTLEELDEIFESKNPVKASLQKKKIDVDRDGDVVNVQAV